MKHKYISFIIGDINTMGGVETVTRILCELFSSQGAIVTIYSLYSKTSPTQKISNVNIYNLGLKPPDNERNKLYKIKRVILNGLLIRKTFNQLKYSENLIFQGFYLAAYIPFIKKIYSNKIVCEHNTFNAPGIVSRIVRIFIYIVYRPNVIVLTTADETYYRQIGVRNIYKIYNPSPFKIQTSPKIHQNKKLISLGRFTFQKRFDLMIELSTLALKRFPDWKLIIQGDGPDFAKIKDSAQKSKTFEQFEIRPAGDPTNLYLNGDIFLMTSIFEGLPMTLIEAFSFGIPVVAFKCSPGLQEIIVDGYNGFLVEMNDNKGFVEKVIKLIENTQLRDTLGRNAQESSKKFSSPEILSKWERIFR